MNFQKILVLSIAFLIGGNSLAQSVRSPYSRNGLGDLLFQGLPNNFAMGEVGIGSPAAWHINLQNPSFLVTNGFSSFQVGLSGDFRNYESNADTGSENAASLRFLAMSFPVVSKRWASSFALLPLSTVGYSTFSQEDVGATATSITEFEGEGGISQLIWANGFRIYKTLALGVKASYVFGNISRESRVQLAGEDFGSNYAISYFQETAYSDVNLSLGVSYKFFMKENTRAINIGGIYELSNELEGVTDEFYQRLSLSGATIQGQSISEGEKSTYGLPESFGFGLSYEVIGKVLVGVDYKTQGWGNANRENADLTLRNTTNIALGASFTPDYRSVKNYLKRGTYRFGANYKQLPYLVNNTEINDFGINFGVSLPVNVYSSMDLAFKFGQRGTTNNNLIQEKYFQVLIGATINDRWFIKRRYD
ncbi:MAG: hypothetical protein JXR10_03145 [Cyclobacteriaceae bacterium]